MIQLAISTCNLKLFFLLSSEDNMVKQILIDIIYVVDLIRRRIICNYKITDKLQNLKEFMGKKKFSLKLSKDLFRTAQI